MECLTAAAIYAGILLARRVPSSTAARHLEAVRVRVGPADESAYDYQGAEALISQFGDAFFSSRDNDALAFRETLMNYVLNGGPGWPDLLPAGRRVVTRSLTPNARQCFEIARLLDDHDSDTVSWWDACAAAVRLRRSDAWANDGREAERLSLQIETAFLRGSNLNPIWMALEDNGFGCDIQSFRPGPDGWADARTHFIEVKSTLGRRRFYISRNEWSFASRHADSWELQFWDMRMGRLQSLSFAELVDHMPRNYGSGEWISVMISMEGFDA
jgi:hypothetical protein